MSEPLPRDALREAWLREYIRTVREAVASTPSALIQATPSFILSILPTQILSLNLGWLQALRLYVLHLRKSADGEVWAYTLPDEASLIDLLEELRSHPRFAEEVPPESEFRPRPPLSASHASLLESRWVNLLKDVQGRVFDRPTGAGSGYSWSGPTLQEMDVRGPGGTLSPKDFLRERLEEGRKFERLREKFGPEPGKKLTKEEIAALVRTSEEERSRLQGWTGAYSYPPIRIGPAPTRPLRTILQLETNPQVGQFGDVAFTTAWKTNTFIGTDLGFLAFDSRDSVLVARRLNLVFGALHLRGTPMDSVLATELCQFQYEPIKKTAGGSSVPPSSHTILNKLPRDHSFYAQPRAISLEGLQQAVLAAQKIEGDLRLPILIPYLLDASSRLSEKEWDHSFFSSWIVLERHLRAETDEVIARKKVTSESLRELKRTSAKDFGGMDDRIENFQESTFYTIKVLENLGAITETESRDLDHLRDRRNRILHPTEIATEEDARACYDTARGIVSYRFQRLAGSVAG